MKYMLLFTGMDISPIDLLNIEAFTSKVISLTEYRRGLAEYLRSKMKQVAPNLGTLIGDQARPYFPYPIFSNVTFIFIQLGYIQYISLVLNCLYTIEKFINQKQEFFFNS